MKNIKRLFTLLGCIFVIISATSCIVVEVSHESVESKIKQARESIDLDWKNKTDNPSDAYSIFEWTQPRCLNGNVERYLLSKNDASQFSSIKKFDKKDFWIVPAYLVSKNYDDDVSIKSTVSKVTLNYLIHYDEPVYLWIEYSNGNFYNLGKFELD